MSQTIFDKILTQVLREYLSYDDATIDQLLVVPDLAIIQRVEKIDHLEVVIHSKDHDPPHFHVRSNDLAIHAKFSIET